MNYHKIAQKNKLFHPKPVNWLFNDIWCNLFIVCFDWKIGVFQQTVVRVYYIFKWAKLKTELEEYGGKLRLMRHFRNGERPFSCERFKPKSYFNPRNKDDITETYLSCLLERLLVSSFLLRDSRITLKMKEIQCIVSKMINL